jgi:hypothetical protein
VGERLENETEGAERGVRLRADGVLHNDVLLEVSAIRDVLFGVEEL